ncbi:hypothetical protein C0991_000484 [Blastosporella zonata]|nr:hypothetical protein C0991_000484 [Blastosporella zonata]
MPSFNRYPLTTLEAASIPPSNLGSEQGHYDYIVVGGGTAGCVLASRLSEDPGVKVLLLERGGARLGWATRVPLISTNFLGDENAAYSWPSAPVANLSGNPSLTMVTGKGLGGGSGINSMAYTRGYPQDYDLWSDSGRKGWSYKEIEGYFKKSEKFAGTPERNSKHHGTNGAAVTSLDIEGDEHQSYVKGVSFQAATGGDEKIYHARAIREVILCAGAIANPQILLLSGVGARHKVKQPLKTELAGVGESLQDHMSTGIMFNVPKAESLHIVQQSPLRAILEIFRYIAFGEGLFLSPVTQLSILVDSAQIDDSGHVIPTKATDPPRLPDIEIQPIHWNITEPPVPHKEGVLSLIVVLMRPASRGTVSIASEDPLERPACDLGYFTDPADYAVMRKGLKLAKRIGEKMREYGAKMTDLYMPDSESDADLDAFVQKFTRTNYHYASTCRMGPESDFHPGVVGDDLRVHRIPNLRIADCSIIPIMISTHPQAPAVMIAEKCADMIKAAHK